MKKIPGTWWAILTFVFYISGYVFMDITDVESTERVLTYNDIYFCSFFFIFLALMIGEILYGNEKSENEIKHIIFAFCILGVLLIYLTEKGNIISTVLFWLGIISALLSMESDKRAKKDKDVIP